MLRMICLLCLAWIILMGCQSPPANSKTLLVLDGGFRYHKVSKQVSLAFVIGLKPSISTNTYLEAHFSTPQGTKVVSHIVTSADYLSHRVMLESPAMLNWQMGKNYIVKIVVYKDASKQVQLDVLKQKAFNYIDFSTISIESNAGNPIVY